MPTCTALIVAGGRGSRFGGPLPKQYATLAGQPVLRRTLEGRWGIGRGDDPQPPPHSADPDERLLTPHDEARGTAPVPTHVDRRP